MQIMAVALEDGMLGDRQENIEIAGRAAIGAGRAFARQADAGAFLDAGRHIHIQGAFLLHHAGAAAGLAGIADDLAGAAAGRAGALDGEEALGGAHLAVARAGGTGLGLWPASAPEPAQASQATMVGTLISAARPREGFFQADFQIVAQVLAAILALGAAAAAHHLAENILEHIAEAAEIAERIAAARAGRRAHAAFEGGMAETVIGGALLIVLQDVIGFVDFLELDFGGVVAGILVGMKPHRQLAIGGFQNLAGRALLAFQGLVITALHDVKSAPG